MFEIKNFKANGILLEHIKILAHVDIPVVIVILF
jgi:hypothetical protein